jgi:hypothetical protein
MCCLRSLCRRAIFARPDPLQGFPHVFQTGLFLQACHEWKRQPVAAKTYLLVKKHILLAQQDNRNEERTTKQTRYGLAVQKLEEMMENFANYVAVEQVTQASTLAAAHEEKLMSDTANQQALQDLTNHYAQLAKQLEALAKWHNPATNRLQGCTAGFSATEVHIEFNGKTVLTGARVPPGLWTTKLNNTFLPSPQANSTYTMQIKSNAIKFLRASWFSVMTATWTKAINQGVFRSIPSSQPPMYNAICQSQWQQPWGISINNAKTSSLPKRNSAHVLRKWPASRRMRISACWLTQQPTQCLQPWWIWTKCQSPENPIPT